jgi:D-alanyl-D-alanine carboxypeptidase
MVLLRMAEEGKVGLDDPVAVHLPGFKLDPRITLRMLAQHTSGLEDYLRDHALRARFSREPARQWPAAWLVESALAMGPTGAPGADYAYSNTGYVVLGMALAQASGLELQTLVSRYVLQPLGLGHSHFSIDPALPAPVAQGYQLGSRDAPSWWRGRGRFLHRVSGFPPSAWHGAGAMYSRLGDLRRLVDGVVRGQLLGVQARAAQTAWLAYGQENGQQQAYGLGLEREGELIGHAGQVPGYQVRIWWRERDALTVVVLCNLYASGRGEMPAERIARAVLRLIP